MPFKLVSLNIERSAHLDRIAQFLREENPDVACFQELCERDIGFLAGTLPDFEYAFCAMTHETKDAVNDVVGIGIFARGMSSNRAEYYRRESEGLPASDFYDEATYSRKHYAVLFAEVPVFGINYRFATTHFTWSRGGEANDEQRRDMKSLLSILKRSGSFVLAGDFNAPRGGEIFSALAGKYKDTIPPEYTTSID